MRAQLKRPELACRTCWAIRTTTRGSAATTMAREVEIARRRNVARRERGGGGSRQAKAPRIAACHAADFVGQQGLQFALPTRHGGNNLPLHMADGLRPAGGPAGQPVTGAQGVDRGLRQQVRVMRRAANSK